VTRARGRHGRRRPLAGLTVAALVAALVAGTAALTWASGAIQGPAPTSAASIQPPVTGNPVVNTLLGRMSLAEKFRLLEWITAPGQPQTATLPGLRRLGIPALHLAEGPLGTARQPSAAMTAPLGVAATFSRADAYANGVVLGRDARARGQQAVARPFGVLGSGAAGGQAGASFGEDPLLAGGTAAAEIAGIQAQGTMAVSDDYPAGPGGAGVVPSSAALHEIYLQPVEDAVRAGAAGVLCSPFTGPGGAAIAGTAGTTGTAGTAAADTAGNTGTATGGTATAGPAGNAGTAQGAGTTPPAGTALTGPAPPGTPPAGTPPPGTPAVGTTAGGTPTAPANPAAPGIATLPAGTGTPPAGPATGSAGPATGSTGSAAVPATAVPTGRAGTPPGPAFIRGNAGKHTGPAPCGNPGLLIQILRSELGFTGFVLAGPGANPGTPSLGSGLDGEVLAAGRAGARYFTPAALHAAIASKTITTATVNQAVAVVLTEMDRFGLLGPQPAHRPAAEPAAAGERVISRTAADAATLLQNSGHALPLTPAALSSLALIGPGADQVIGTGPAADGSAAGSISPPATLQVLRQDLAADPAAHLSFAVGDDLTGIPVPAAVLTHEGQPGLVRSSTGHDATRVVCVLDNSLAGHDALAAGSGHTWAGELTVPATGTYWISLGTGGSWGTLTLDGAVVAQDGPGQPVTGAAPVAATDGLRNLRAKVTLTAGIHTLGVSESPDGSGRPVQIRLNWVTPEQQRDDLIAAVATARAATAAVVFAWSNGGASLPDGQDELIQDVAAVNPDTIVVLNTQGPVSMPWLSAVRSVLEMWYPGDAGGAATANVLLGRDDPAGRLPVTWPALPHRFRRNQPTGIFVGYRRYDKDGIAPLFPFGYGMSYTRFGYSALNWHATPGRGLVLRLRVSNTGGRAGTAVPQAYLGAPATAPPGAAFARRALAAYTRVSLRPGQSRIVTLTVPQRQLQFWQDARGWIAAPGKRRVYVGGDERASALSATVLVPR
jgi:beta-glucosidase